MNNKELETKALNHLVLKLSSDGYECKDVRSDRNKGWDLEAKLNNLFYPIEIKCTRSKKWTDSNLRFTWQTLCSAYKHNLLNQLILAVVVDSEAESPTIQYCRFCDVKEGELFVEPHFLIQLNRLMREGMLTYGKLQDLPMLHNDMMDRFGQILKSPISRWVDVP